MMIGFAKALLVSVALFTAAAFRTQQSEALQRRPTYVRSVINSPRATFRQINASSLLSLQDNLFASEAQDVWHSRRYDGPATGWTTGSYPALLPWQSMREKPESFWKTHTAKKAELVSKVPSQYNIENKDHLDKMETKPTETYLRGDETLLDQNIQALIVVGSSNNNRLHQAVIMVTDGKMYAVVHLLKNTGNFDPIKDRSHWAEIMMFDTQTDAASRCCPSGKTKFYVKDIFEAQPQTKVPLSKAWADMEYLMQKHPWFTQGYELGWNDCFVFQQQFVQMFLHCKDDAQRAEYCSRLPSLADLKEELRQKNVNSSTQENSTRKELNSSTQDSSTRQDDPVPTGSGGGSRCRAPQKHCCCIPNENQCKCRRSSSCQPDVKSWAQKKKDKQSPYTVLDPSGSRCIDR